MKLLVRGEEDQVSHAIFSTQDKKRPEKTLDFLLDFFLDFPFDFDSNWRSSSYSSWDERVWRRLKSPIVLNARKQWLKGRCSTNKVSREECLESKGTLKREVTETEMKKFIRFRIISSSSFLVCLPSFLLCFSTVFFERAQRLVSIWYLHSSLTSYDIMSFKSRRVTQNSSQNNS